MKHCFLKIILLISISLVLFSCKTTKTTIDKNEKSIVTTDIKETEKKETEQNSTLTFTINSDALITIIEKIVNEKLSSPDSTGKQVVIERTITERKIDRKENVMANAEGKQKVKQDITKVKEDHSKIKNQSKTKETKKVTIKTPTWVFVSVAILVIGLLIFVYLLLKRYRIL
jgi:cobalamin biosynthesis Mg chelatase CobN